MTEVDSIALENWVGLHFFIAMLRVRLWLSMWFQIIPENNFSYKFNPKTSDAASFPTWLQWAFWLSPTAYAEIGLSINEFQAPRWQKVSCS